MRGQLKDLDTEKRNCRTTHIDDCATIEMVRLMNEEDRTVPLAVEKALPAIAKAIDIISDRLSGGGRLIYVGAGTSGRLGVVDASECPPTFGTDPQMVQGIIAGGAGAIFQAVEGLEDDVNAGAMNMDELNISRLDAVVGIAASGRTPFVIGAMKEAGKRGAAVIGLCNTENSEFTDVCDVLISVVVGPEVITGSTRLKAGTAQKLVLNMITTCSMIRLGKVYDNLMVDLKVTNGKLRDRAVRMICTIADVTPEKAEKALDETQGNTKTAILMCMLDCDAQYAKETLARNGGILKRAVLASKR